MKIWSGVESSRFFLDRVRSSLSLLGSIRPCLAVVIVGSDPASQVYVRKKSQVSQDLGMDSQLIELPESVTQDELAQTVTQLNQDSQINGILVQLPLPSHIDSYAILSLIDYRKDVDGFHCSNLGNIIHDRPYLAPCTPFGVLQLCRYYGYDLSSRHVVVIGRSVIVGKSLSLLLLMKGVDATVTVCHSKTQNLKNLTQQADVLVVASGIPEMVDYQYVSQDTIVIDVGIHRKDDGKLCGDVRHCERLESLVSCITPVPGGVGPMTIAMLMCNTVLACALQNNIHHVEKSLFLDV